MGEQGRILQRAMAQLLSDPSHAYVLGTLADLRREYRTLSATLAAASGDTQGLEDSIAVLWREKKALMALRADGQTAARQLGEKNALQAELYPKLAKLRARAETLAQAQAAAGANTDARALRRSRAVVNVQIDDLSKDVARAESEAQALRDEVRRLENLMRDGRKAGQDAQDAVDRAQAQQPSLLQHSRACALRLAIAHGQLRLTGPTPTAAELSLWRAEVLAVATSWQALCDGMAQGRYADDETQPLMGGRSVMTGEIVAGLIALGDPPQAQAAFVRMCSGHGFLHQIFHVYRAFVLGHLVGQDLRPLIEVLRLHRYAQGLRGALSECLWQYLRDDGEGFARALPQVVAQEAQMWRNSELPGLGLISLTGCALSYLGHLRGLPVPQDLGPTVPKGPWSVATSRGVR